MHAASLRCPRLAARAPLRIEQSRRRFSFKTRVASRAFHSSVPAKLSLFPFAGPNSGQDATPSRGTSKPEESPKEAEQTLDPPNAQPVPLTQEVIHSAEGADPASEGNNGNNDKDKSTVYGSATKRSTRNRRPKEVPPLTLDQKFLVEHVRLHSFGVPLRRDFVDIVEAPRNISASYSSAVPDTELESKREEIYENAQQGTGMEHESSTEPSETSPSIRAVTELSSLTESARFEKAMSLLRSEPWIAEPIWLHLNNVKADLKGQPLDGSSSPTTYRIQSEQYQEVENFVRGGFNVPAFDSPEDFPGNKTNLSILCPVDGATIFLENVVERVATSLGADIVRLDAQSLGEIGGAYIREGPDVRSNAIWTLGYDAPQVFNRKPHEEELEQEDMEQEDFGEEEEDGTSRSKPRFIGSFAVPLMGLNSGSLGGVLQNAFKQIGPMGSVFPPGGSAQRANGQGSHAGGNGNSLSSAQWNDMKLSALIEVLIDAPEIKAWRLQNSLRVLLEQLEPHIKNKEIESREELDQFLDKATYSADVGNVASAKAPQKRRTIVLVSGFRELHQTFNGAKIIDKLYNSIQRRRYEGEEIVFVGVSASSQLTAEVSSSMVHELQNDDSIAVWRNIVVTPDVAGPTGGVFYRDERRRAEDINIRNMHAMINRTWPDHDRQMDDFTAFASDMKTATGSVGDGVMKDALSDKVLSVDEVHRIVSFARTCSPPQVPVSEAPPTTHSTKAAQTVAAMTLLQKSDNTKRKWAEDEQALQKPASLSGSEQKPRHSSDQQLKKLRKQCNAHEKKLLNGVVRPEDVHVGFNDVHAPKETVEALKTLTTLSLTRPDAFKYGVLASDKISGLLLYGPPGTGKTMLAKAVAKESGATMLEVSGSDVYDMYVGEGEKNVRAVFSLAKKLAPCVVFIDEADAIFASRNSGSNRNSHRELINQFLREWDGLTETTAFIMVATNRPFDLDDAALRRLPRRLLVDLPTEKDREAILGIHLRDERLEAGVSLTELASKTKLYSGSDLKNVCVAAALAAVREENEAAAAAPPSSEPYSFPEKRTLLPSHFDRALEEISASISEDMSSLQAIKKFDEKYGDRRGRRKKVDYGFGSGMGRKEENVKVRM